MGVNAGGGGDACGDRTTDATTINSTGAVSMGGSSGDGGGDVGRSHRGGISSLKSQQAVQVTPHLLGVAFLKTFPLPPYVQVVWVLTVQVCRNVFPTKKKRNMVRPHFVLACYCGFFWVFL